MTPTSTATPHRLPPELAFYVPFPSVLIGGCRPLVPFHGFGPDIGDDGPPYRAPRAPERIGEHPDAYGLWPTGLCPACRGGIDGDPDAARRRLTHCLVCGGMDATNEGHARVQYDIACAQSRAEADLAGERADLDALGAELKASGRTLTERERRRIWNGYKGGLLEARGLPAEGEALSERERRSVDRAILGREWLTRIGQVPDFDVALDSRGKAVGRWSEGYRPPE
jgi:hypothetical protein